MSKTSRIERTKQSIQLFRAARERNKEEAEELKTQQGELVEVMKHVDPENRGLVIDPDDKSKGTAFVQQNTGSLVWDDEKILEWLTKDVRGRRSIYLDVTTRMLDIQKWEAEVAAGRIPKKIAKQMQKRLAPPSPFIRFGKKGKDSL